MSKRERLVDYVRTAELDGLDELEDEDIITGAAIVLCTSRLRDRESSLLVASDTDWITVTGMLTLAQALQTGADDDERP